MLFIGVRPRYSRGGLNVVVIGFEGGGLERDDAGREG